MRDNNCHLAHCYKSEKSESDESTVKAVKFMIGTLVLLSSLFDVIGCCFFFCREKQVANRRHPSRCANNC